MSAECGKCGHDLDYYLNCAVCTQRERAEQAEAQRDALAEALRKIALMADLPSDERWMIDAHDIVAVARSTLDALDQTNRESNTSKEAAQ